MAVGGDGIYNEVMSGLLDREMRDNGRNPDDPEAQLVQLRLPIGIVPAGIPTSLHYRKKLNTKSRENQARKFTDNSILVPQYNDVGNLQHDKYLG